MILMIRFFISQHCFVQNLKAYLLHPPPPSPTHSLFSTYLYNTPIPYTQPVLNVSLQHPHPLHTVYSQRISTTRPSPTHSLFSTYLYNTPIPYTQSPTHRLFSTYLYNTPIPYTQSVLNVSLQHPHPLHTDYSQRISTTPPSPTHSLFSTYLYNTPIPYTQTFLNVSPQHTHLLHTACS